MMPRHTGALRVKAETYGAQTLPGLDIKPTPVGLGLGLTDAGRKRARRAPVAATSAKVRPAWSPYYGKPEVCGEGSRILHEQEQGRPIVGAVGHTTHATYARTYNGERTLMCKKCAESWRVMDGFTTPLPSRPAKQIGASRIVKKST